MTSKEQVRSYIAAANAATGESDATCRAAVERLIAGYLEGKRFHIAPKTGLYYSEIMVTPADAQYSVQGHWFDECNELVELTVGKLYNAYQFADAWVNMTKLEKIAFPNQTAYEGGNTVSFRGAQRLSEMQLGSLGHPVTRIDFNLYHGGLSLLTIYCTGPENVVLDHTPISARTTVIYRDSTTGEVFEL